MVVPTSSSFWICTRPLTTSSLQSKQYHEHECPAVGNGMPLLASPLSKPGRPPLLIARCACLAGRLTGADAVQNGYNRAICSYLMLASVVFPG